LSPSSLTANFSRSGRGDTTFPDRSGMSRNDWPGFAARSASANERDTERLRALGPGGSSSSTTGSRGNSGVLRWTGSNTQSTLDASAPRAESRRRRSQPKRMQKQLARNSLRPNCGQATSRSSTEFTVTRRSSGCTRPATRLTAAHVVPFSPLWADR
jgi:hypothetical protein